MGITSGREREWGFLLTLLCNIVVLLRKVRENTEMSIAPFFMASNCVTSLFITV